MLQEVVCISSDSNVDNFKWIVLFTFEGDYKKHLTIPTTKGLD